MNKKKPAEKYLNSFNRSTGRFPDTSGSAG